MVDEDYPSFIALHSTEIVSSSFYKPDIVVPFSHILKIHSMDQLEKKGVDLDFAFDKVFRPDKEDERKEVFNTRKFQERFDNMTQMVSQKTDWSYFRNDIDFEELDLENHALGATDENGQNEIVKNARIASKNIVYPLIGTWPPTNILVYKGAFRK